MISLRSRRAQPAGAAAFARLDYADAERAAHLRLELHGELDMSDAALLEDTLDQVTALPPCPITVELAEVTFLGSTGLGFLSALYRHAYDGGYHVTLNRPTPFVRRALSICGFDGVCTVTDS